MELENIVANTVYLKAREGKRKHARPLAFHLQLSLENSIALDVAASQ